MSFLSLTEATRERRQQSNVVQKETTMKNLFARFAKDESGATAIEYGLIAALISVVCIGIWGTIGGSLNTKFTAINTGLTK